jgi:hypothetical protein
MEAQADSQCHLVKGRKKEGAEIARSQSLDAKQYGTETAQRSACCRGTHTRTCLDQPAKREIKLSFNGKEALKEGYASIAGKAWACLCARSSAYRKAPRTKK